MNQDTMVSLVQGQLDAYNARDVEKFCSFYHPEVEAWDINATSFKTDLICRGIKDFKQIYGKKFENTPELFCELKHRTITKFSILDEEMVTVKKDAPLVHAVALYHFKDNLIYRIHFTK